MATDLQEVDQLVRVGRLQEALSVINDMIERQPSEASLYFMRGKIYWKLGNHSAATGDYARAADIDPASPAVYALEQAREIAGFFNPDLYNP